MPRLVESSKAPKALAAYSQALLVGDLLFCSGQIGIDPQTQSLISEDIRAQTHQAFRNLSEVLQAASCSLKDLVKVTVYLQDMRDYRYMNEIYEQYVQKPFPVRTTVAVSALPLGARVEIEAMACPSP